MNARERDLLLGQIAEGEIGAAPGRVVRLFVCSAATDSVHERNALVERVYPYVRDHCRERHGLEFQAVDLHWGTEKDRYPDDHARQTFFMEEIKRCGQISVGPNFLLLVGQKLGDRSLPAILDEQEYRQIRHALKRHKGRQTRNWALLEDWYEWNENSVPHSYTLKPVSSMIPEYSDTDETVRKTGEAEWKEVEAELLRLIEKGAEWCHVDGVFDEETKNKYSLSDLESQIKEGILDRGEESHGRCFVVCRNIIDLKNYTNEKNAEDYTELVYNQPQNCMEMDTAAQNRVKTMTTKLESTLPAHDIARFDVLWRFDEVINPKLHRDYLDKFCQTVQEGLIRQIDEIAKERKLYNGSATYQEVHQHLLRCQDIAQCHYGRDSLITKINSYLTGTSCKPLIIHGVSGVGKTSVVSKCCLQAQTLFPRPVITVVRYIGYTPQSSNLRQLMVSLCFQLTMALDSDLNDIPTGCPELVVHFQKLLTLVPPDLQLVIFLDAISQIRSDFDAHSLSWLPKTLSHNVRLVISLRTEKQVMMTRLKEEIVRDSECFLEICALESEDALKILNDFLEMNHRKITEEQLTVINPLLETCRLPLYVKILASNVCKSWTSSTHVSLQHAPEHLEEAIHQIFEELENDFGKITIARALGYVVASESGLSDSEIEDVLSLDNAVLDEVFFKHKPLIYRLPPWIWKSLKTRLSPFISSKETDGTTVNFLSHEKFNEMIRSRYLSCGTTMEEIHSLLADYFLGRWANKPKPTSSVETTKDRLVPAQPHTFTGANGVTNYNRRKYDQVPRHLFLSRRLKELDQVVLFNYEWLYNKTKALSLQQTLLDMSLNPGRETTLVEQCLSSSRSVIEKDIRNLAAEITGHLLPHYDTHQNIRQLIKNCDRQGLFHNGLVAVFPYHQITGSSLLYTLDTGVPIDQCFLTSDEKHLVVKGKETPNVITCDAVRGDMRSTLVASTGNMYITPNGKYYVIVDHITEKTVKIHSTKDGEYIGQLVVMNHIDVKPKGKYHVTSVCVSNHSVCLVVTTDKSYLCIAEVPGCKFRRIIELDGRSTVCSLTPDGSHLYCNSGPSLLIHDFITLEHTCTTSLSHRPSSIVFTKDGRRCYLSSEFENKIIVMHISNGKVEIVYKAVIEEWLVEDSIAELKISPDENVIVARGSNNLIVYDRMTEKAVAHFPRPQDALSEFKLPKGNYQELKFTQVSFSWDSRYIFGSIFRNIYMWEIATCNLVTTIQTPSGLIDKILVSQKHDHIFTVHHGQPTVQVWSVRDVVNKVDPLDQLSNSVRDIQITSDQSLAFVRCESGEEIAVVEMNYGTTVDLLTHESPVEDFVITPNGSHALVCTKPKWSNCAVKIWDLERRQIISEFGNTGGYCVGFHGKNSLLLAAQYDFSFKAPYFITMFNVDCGDIEECPLYYEAAFLLSRPFITADDQHLVMLTAADYMETSGIYDTPMVAVVNLETCELVREYTPFSFRNVTKAMALLDVRPCPVDPNSVALIYLAEGQKEGPYRDDGRCVCPQYGFFVLDITKGGIKAMCQPFMNSRISIDNSLLLAKDFAFAIDASSNIFDAASRSFTGKVPDCSSKPWLLALEGKMAVYAEGSSLKIVRLVDYFVLSVCETHSEVTFMKLCGDERSLVVGCKDGTLLCYVIVDPEEDDVEAVLSTVQNRHTESDDDRSSSRRTSRAWDKVNEEKHIPGYSRPPSAKSTGPNQKELLEKVQPVPRPRPKSDTFLYLNEKSVTCALM